MKRLLLLLVLVQALMAPVFAQAQAGGQRVFRVAWIAPEPLAPAAPAIHDGYFDAVLKQLESQGFVRGRNLETRMFFRRTTPGSKQGRWREEVIAEAAAWRPNVIVVGGAPSARAARRARISIPVVFALVQEPVAEGIVENLRKPEGNITGAGIDYYLIAAKRLELARELLPSLRRVAVVVDKRAGGIPPAAWKEFMSAAERMGLVVSEIDVGTIEGGLCAAGKRVVELRAEAVLPMGNIGPPAHEAKSWVQGYGDCLYEMQRRSRTPVLDDSSDTVHQGVVAAIGEDSLESFKRAGKIVARLLNGARPGDVPVDMQMRIETVLNTKSAREIGLAVPRSMLMRADRVVE